MSAGEKNRGRWIQSMMSNWGGGGVQAVSVIG